MVERRDPGTEEELGPAYSVGLTFGMVDGGIVHGDRASGVSEPLPLNRGCFLCPVSSENMIFCE